MKRVLLTGASGFIGRHCWESLSAKGYEVHAVSSKLHPRDSRVTGVEWHTADLLDMAQVSELVARVRPTHLLHCAWYVVPGKCYTSPENYRWVQASLELLREFASHGGQRVVMTGTCAEYDPRHGSYSENETPLRPDSVYGTCKHALQLMFNTFVKQTQLCGAWARVFFLYGPHEPSERLVPSVIRSLLLSKSARCSHGNQIRDYLHVQDVADALVALLDSDVEGSVNVASGQPLAVKDMVYIIARKLGRTDLVRLGSIQVPEGEPPRIVANTQRLTDEVGWRPEYHLDRGLDHTIRWWKTNMPSGKDGIACPILQ